MPQQLHSSVQLPAELVSARPDWASLMFFFADIGFEDGLVLKEHINDDTALFLGQYLWRVVSGSPLLPQWEFEDTVAMLFADPRMPRGLTHLKIYQLLARARGYSGYIEAKEELVRKGYLENKLNRGRAALMHFSS